MCQVATVPAHPCSKTHTCACICMCVSVHLFLFLSTQFVSLPTYAACTSHFYVTAKTNVLKYPRLPPFRFFFHSILYCDLSCQVHARCLNPEAQALFSFFCALFVSTYTHSMHCFFFELHKVFFCRLSARHRTTMNESEHRNHDGLGRSSLLPPFFFALRSSPPSPPAFFCQRALLILCRLRVTLFFLFCFVSNVSRVPHPLVILFFGFAHASRFLSCAIFPSVFFRVFRSRTRATCKPPTFLTMKMSKA